MDYRQDRQLHKESSILVVVLFSIFIDFLDAGQETWLIQYSESINQGQTAYSSETEFKMILSNQTYGLNTLDYYSI